METTLIVALVGLSGVALGAWLNLLSSRSNERRRHERELRASAYAAYVSSIGEMETATAFRDSAGQAEARARAIAAKVRVCVHGSAEAVTALAALEGDAGAGLTSTKQAALIYLLTVVRKDLGSPGTVTESDIQKILFPPSV